MLDDNYLIEELEYEHPDYSEYLDTLLLIENLIDGGHQAVKKRYDYLLIRDDEDPKITAKREEKFFTRNHLASAVRLQRTKLGTGKVDYPEEVPGKLEEWNKFLTNSDRQGTDFKELLLEAFEQALTFRTAFAVVDIPQVEVKARNARQQELIEQARIMRGEEILPYVVLLPTTSVINWGEDAKGLTFIKYKLIRVSTQPIGPAISTLR